MHRRHTHQVELQTMLTMLGSKVGLAKCIIHNVIRELAIQIHNEARKFAQGSMIKSVVAYGGTSVFYQASQLQRGCNILVATPGRFHPL